MNPYQLLCPAGDLFDPTVKFSSIAMDNMFDLFPPNDWLVEKLPNGVEDYADWKCRASEFRVDSIFYIPDFYPDPIVLPPAYFSLDKVPHVMERNRQYRQTADDQNSTSPIGNPKIKHTLKDFSMGGMIDLYDADHVSGSRYNAWNYSDLALSDLHPETAVHLPEFSYWSTFGACYANIRFFLFEGDFYVAWHKGSSPYTWDTKTLTLGARSITQKVMIDPYGEGYEHKISISKTFVP